MFDVVVVGAGPAGVSSAWSLKNKKVAIVDVGFNAPDTFSREPFLNLVGNDFCGVENITNKSISPKLRAPLMRFITRAPDIKEAQLQEDGFTSVLSYARGGLSNAWGAGVFEFNDKDLLDFPIKSQDLKEHYSELISMIGVSGSNDDDLSEVWGSRKELQAPLKLSPLATHFLERYNKNKNLFNENGFRVGRPRLAILTENKGERKAFSYDNTEFYVPNNSSIYHAGYTLNELIKSERVTYIAKSFVTHFEENDDGVCIYIKNSESGEYTQLKTKKLILAAGAIQSGAIVLRSYKDTNTQLPLLDNPISFLPIVFPKMLGTPAQRQYFGGAELNIYWERDAHLPSVQASFYSLAGVMRSDLVREFPFVWTGNMWAMREISPAIGVAQFFYPDTVTKDNYLLLQTAGHLRVNYRSNRKNDVEVGFCKALRSSGCIAFPFLAKRPVAGSSIHYAGTLGMGVDQRYSTDVTGLLRNTKNVYAADASTFPRLPSKNLTLTIMANAMRIASALN